MDISDKISAVADAAAECGCEVIFGAGLCDYTSFKVGGSCGALVKINSEYSIKRLIPLAESIGAPYFIFGRGSNLIVDSDGVRGIVFLIGKDFSEISADGNILNCAAGASLYSVCAAALENSLSGIEFAYGIPGSVGGAVYMNAGAYGGEMRDVVESVAAMDRSGNIRRYMRDELDFSYRHSRFFDSGEIIISAEISLSDGNKDEIKAKMADIYERRRSKQPLEFPSAGSAFKRPEGSYAALLIEECGLKGLSVGGAEVSRKHSGFIINKGGATSGDILTLMKRVRAAVKEKTGYELECEPVIISDVEKGL